ncbi:MAG: hypothetical protein HN380_12680 [Victivallales bacterium]|nr:hypothetical protein [Victivallales bacterium]
MRCLPLLLLLASALLARAADAVPGDANGDGVLNVADHAFVQAIVNRRLAATAAADVDGDGQVTQIDADAVADLILGQVPFLAVGTGEIPTTGGTLSVGDLGIAATAGALPATAHVVVATAAMPSPYDGPDDSPMYRIEGIPTRHGAGLTLSLPQASLGRRVVRAEEVFLAVGEEVFLRSTVEPCLATSIVTARLEGDRLVADLPPVDAPPPRRDEEIPETRTVLVRRVTGVASDETSLSEEARGGRPGVAVRIYRPAAMPPSAYAPMVTALGAAIKKLKVLGFSPSARTTPVYVYLKKLPAGVDGYYVGSGWSVDNSSLEINLDNVITAGKLAVLQRTVYHEYFHMVQARFDPRYAYTQAQFNAPQLWFDEACSVWFEKFAPAAGGDTSSYMSTNASEVLAGHHMDCSGLARAYKALKKKVENHGYGLSMMLEYLFTQGPAETAGKANPVLVNTYTSLHGGATIRDAFVANVPPVATWWDDFLLAFANETVGVPGIAFGSHLQGRSSSVKLTSAQKSPGVKKLDLGVCDDCQSWVTIANWQAVGAKAKRRLVVECAYPDNVFRLMALNSVRRHGNPLAADGTSFGKYGDSYVSYLTTPMTTTNNGKTIRPLHYLIVRHLRDSAAGAPGPKMSIWYVDAEMPVKSSGDFTNRLKVAPKLIDYSVVGTATSDDALRAEEALLYDAADLSRVVSRGGASFMVPNEGAFDVPISVTVGAQIAPESIYRIKRYCLRVYYYNKAGETREEILRTYTSPGANIGINVTVTLGADDEHAFIDVYADEDFKAGASMEPNVTYSLRSWFNIGTVHRYESVLKGTYGAPAGSRQDASVPNAVRKEIMRKNGVTSTKSVTLRAASVPLPAKPSQSE